MSSLPFLTSELQALSKEAGRRHPDVKDVSSTRDTAERSSSFVYSAFLTTSLRNWRVAGRR